MKPTTQKANGWATPVRRDISLSTGIRQRRKLACSTPRNFNAPLSDEAACGARGGSESEADRDIARGDVASFNSMDDLIADLDSDD